MHTEDVTSDFVRADFKPPRYHITRAIPDIQEKLEKTEDISIYEYDGFNDVIQKIEQAFTEGFDCANPDKTSNASRAEIAHGHANEKETAANSLKHFRYLSEISH